MEDDEWVFCDYCGNEINQNDATYVEGRPYCKKCHSEAEVHTDINDGDDDDDEDDDDDNDDDDDDDDYD